MKLVVPQPLLPDQQLDIPNSLGRVVIDGACDRAILGGHVLDDNCFGGLRDGTTTPIALDPRTGRMTTLSSAPRIEMRGNTVNPPTTCSSFLAPNVDFIETHSAEAPSAVGGCIAATVRAQGRSTEREKGATSPNGAPSPLPRAYSGSTVFVVDLCSITLGGLSGTTTTCSRSGVREYVVVVVVVSFLV